MEIPLAVLKLITGVTGNTSVTVACMEIPLAVLKQHYYSLLLLLLPCCMHGNTACGIEVSIFSLLFMVIILLHAWKYRLRY